MSTNHGMLPVLFEEVLSTAGFPEVSLANFKIDLLLELFV